MTTSCLVPAGAVGLAEPIAGLARSRAGAADARTPTPAALALGLLLAACAGDHAAVTGPSPITPTEAVTRGTCGGSSPLQLGVLQGITLDCATATSVQLAAVGATYLVVPQLATDAGTLQPVSYSLAASGGVSQAAVVAAAVERNEPLFEATLLLAGARRTAMWVCLASRVAAVAFGAWAVRRSR